MGKQEAVFDAVKSGDFDEVKKLTKPGFLGLVKAADPGFYYESEGISLIMLALVNRHTDIVEHLVKAGGNVNVADKVPLLYVAAQMGDIDLVQLFLDHGADVNQTGIEGITALFPAVENRAHKIVELLLEAGADVNATKDNKDTPLAYAANFGCLECARWLLERGADLNAANDSGSTPLHISLTEKHEDIAWLLLAKGADVDARRKDGFAPLHAAALWGHVELVAELLKRGAEKNLRAGDGVTPLDFANHAGHEEVVSLLGESVESKPTIVEPLDRYTDEDERRTFDKIHGLSKEEAIAQHGDFDVAYSHHAYEEGTAIGFKNADKDLIEEGLGKAKRKSQLLFLLSAHHIFCTRLEPAFVASVRAFHASQRPPDGAGPHAYAFYLLYRIYENRNPDVAELVAMNNPGIEIRCSDDSHIQKLAEVAEAEMDAIRLDAGAAVLKSRLQKRDGAPPFPRCW